MSLEQVISDIKSGRDFLDFVDEVDLNILGNIQCELSQTGTRREIFDMASGLSDPIIERYLLMDESSKVKMEELYEQEREVFDKVGGIQNTKKEKLNNKYGDCGVFTLRQITNYNRMKSFLEEYCNEVESMDNPIWRNVQIGLNYCTKKGVGSFAQRDFKTELTLKSINNKNVFNSLTYGVSEDLKERTLAAQSLLPQRIKFLEEYCAEVESMDNPIWRNVQIGLNYCIKKGVSSFGQRDFRTGLLFENINNKNVFNSLTYGVSEDLKKRALAAQSLLPQRIKFLEKYCDELENIEKPNWSEVQFGKLSCMKMGITGGWLSRDFRTGFPLEKINNENIFNSLTYGVPEDLKKRMREVQFLLPHRIRFLEKYCDEVENMDKPTLQEVQFGIQYCRSNGVGDWAIRDFKTGDAKKIYGEDFFNNFTYNISDNLKKRALAAQSLLPHRIKFLEEYCAKVEFMDKSTLRKNQIGIRYCNKNGVQSWGERDFRTRKDLKEKTNENILRSITYGVPQELKERVYKLNGIDL